MLNTPTFLKDLYWALLGVPYFNIFFGDLLLKESHDEIRVYTFFSLATSKPSIRGTQNEKPQKVAFVGFRSGIECRGSRNFFKHASTRTYICDGEASLDGSRFAGPVLGSRRKHPKP